MRSLEESNPDRQKVGRWVHLGVEVMRGQCYTGTELRLQTTKSPGVGGQHSEVNVLNELHT